MFIINRMFICGSAKTHSDLDYEGFGLDSWLSKLTCSISSGKRQIMLSSDMLIYYAIELIS